MTDFEADWLAAREPFDAAALDDRAIDAIRAWARARASTVPVTVVDLGSGTGTALRRAELWLEGRPMRAFAVDHDASLLASQPAKVTLVLGDVLGMVAQSGGPADGTVDLVLGHALADLLPLDRLAARVAALLRTGGLAHLALTYDGVTRFLPAVDPAVEALIIDAYHRHMDRPRAVASTHGGSTAGRFLVSELIGAGLEIVSVGPSEWDVRSDSGGPAAAVLTRMLQFVVESATEVGDVPATLLRGWEAQRREHLEQGRLGLQVRHLDVVARRTG